MRALLPCVLVPSLLAVAGAPLSPGGGANSPPFPIWPLPQEAAYEDERLLLREAAIVVGRATSARSSRGSSSPRSWPTNSGP